MGSRGLAPGSQLSTCHQHCVSFNSQPSNSSALFLSLSQPLFQGLERQVQALLSRYGPGKAAPGDQQTSAGLGPGPDPVKGANTESLLQNKDNWGKQQPWLVTLEVRGTSGGTSPWENHQREPWGDTGVLWWGLAM